MVGAFWTNSPALLSDAAHMATDALALMIALVAVRLSRRPPDARRTYGYARLEALGAMINGAMLFVVAAYILWEAVGRFRQPQEIASSGMLVIAAAGLVINLISMRLLQAGSGEPQREGRLPGSMGRHARLGGSDCGRIVDQVDRMETDRPDPAVLIGLWVLPRTYVLMREAINVLLEGVPKGMDVARCATAWPATPQSRRA